MICSRAR